MDKRAQLKHLKRLRVFVAAFKAWRPTKTDRFDMGEWRRPTSCGTVCCAWGLAPAIPAFRRAGVTNIDVFGHTHGANLTLPGGRMVSGLDAATEFFGLAYKEAHVFMPFFYRKGRRATTPTALKRNPVRKGEVTKQLDVLLRRKEREFTEAHGASA